MHAALVLTVALAPAARGSVIPVPAEVVLGQGYFGVDPTTRVRVRQGDRDATAAARYLGELWRRTNGLTLPVTPGPVTGTGGAAAMNAHSIAFRHQSGFAPEGYELKVTPHGITVSASTAAGLFYGAVTLWQLLPPGGHAGQIPVQTIRDAPNYSWRGLMLDSARHFQSPAFIRSMIDWMAWHKLNVLQWHLTDDQGWRLEIRKYPRLTSVGGWRVDPDGTRYGGYYTQKEVREIVRFAATRHVQIVPEIEMPGHATAAIAAYPSLGVANSAAGAPPAVSARWGAHAHVFNLDGETFRFLEDVMAEVIDLFPGRTIHIGGDEARKDEWQASPDVQARARRLGIDDPDSVQAYFTQRIGGYLAAHGRRIIGWDEILRPGLRKDAIVMSWHGISGAHTAAMAGYDAILAPDPTLYFDHRQSTLPTEPPGRLDVISLEDVYRFEAHDATLSDGQRRHVLGVQGNLWTEHIKSEQRVQWMALPRAAALAEVAWSGASRRRWPDFLERLVPMLARYRAFDVNYADSVFAPSAAISPAAEGFVVRLSNQAQSDSAAPLGIRYTLDGREPSAQSSSYDAPLTVPAGTELKAAAFAGSSQVSGTRVVRLDAQSAARRDSHDLEQCSDGVGLLLEPAGATTPLAIDIMNPCWIDRGVDLSGGPRLVAAVAPLPFIYELGADAAKIRVGDARTAEGELDIHIDGCDTPASVEIPLAAVVHGEGVTMLPAQQLPRLPGRHDLCLRFARPRVDPLWALDWIEIRE
jgi:hexosaminidase